VAWFGDPRGIFYRGRGGQWRGDRREEGAPSMATGTGADGALGKGNDVSFEGERGWRGGSSPYGEGGLRPTWRRRRRNERRWRLRGRSAGGGKRRGGLARPEGGGGPRGEGKGSRPAWRGRRPGVCWVGSMKKAKALLGRRGEKNELGC
jgi:hypothetical protein